MAGYGPASFETAKYKRQQAADERRAAIEYDRSLREDLKRKFNVPDEFMDLAVEIWTDGKED